MRREIGVGLAALRCRPALVMLAWSVPEALPTAVSGLAVARALDSGFLAGRPAMGLAWLGALLAAAAAGAAGSGMVYRRLGEVVEPFRDDLARRVVGGALRQAVAGRRDDGAVARLSRQVEIVRDTFAGLVVVIRAFAISVAGAVAGLLSLSPAVALLILLPFVLGLAAFAASLGMAAARQRASVLADERLAAVAGSVFGGVRDLVASGAEEHAARMVAGPIAEQAAAERALARVAAVRAVCLGIGGWLPLLVLLAAGPALVGRGLTAGELLGGLTYVLFGLQPALNRLVSGLGGSGLRYVVTLRRILDATESPPPAAATRREPRPAAAHPAADRTADPAVVVDGVVVDGVVVNEVAGLAVTGPSVGGAVTGPAVMVRPGAPRGYDLACRGLSFRYGPHAEPVLRDLDLDVPEGEHLAIVGASGIGKSTLARLLCGLLRPESGAVCLAGVPVADLPAGALACVRTLIPQEAYAFAGTLRENLAYLRLAATDRQLDGAVAALSAGELVARLGGYDADLEPGVLSAGERQLIALVRAYLSPAPVAVLDEATCHLDPAAERRTEEAFAARGGTLVVIAHRLSSALRARRVLVLDGGTVATGDHATLLATSPLYRELLGHWDAAAPAAPAAADAH